MTNFVPFADIHFGLKAVDQWFEREISKAPSTLGDVLGKMQEIFASHCDYGHHPALILAAQLDPRYARYSSLYFKCLNTVFLP